MVTREECDRARLSAKILENTARMMEKSLPGSLIEHGDVTGKIYETIGKLESLINKQCRR